MARTWRMATAGAIVVSLVGFGVPAFAAAPGADAPTGEARDNLIDKIVKRAEPDLMEVLVTRRDSDGAPTFQTVEVDSKADARSVVGRLLGAPGVMGVEMNQVVDVAKHKKKCRKFKKKPAKYTRCLQRYGHASAGGSPDPLLPQQWALGASYLDFATITAMTAGDTRRPIVAIIDTGIAADHSDLAGRVISQVNFVAGQSVADQCGHGTHVAGIVAANANNGIGIAGLSRTALLQSVKVLGADCSGGLDAVANGIVWAVNNGASVLNLSIEATGSSAALDAAVRYAVDNQRVVVAAAGNGNDLCPGLFPARCTYPAQYPNVLGVAASTQSNTAASFSDVGSWVDVAAPGQGIVSTYLNNGYISENGTSMATPYVSALAAMLISHCGYTGTTVSDRIIGTASHASVRDDSTGYGIIRPQAALAC